MNTNTMTNEVHEISAEALQGLGGGKLAYVKTIRSEDVQKHFPQAPSSASARKILSLHRTAPSLPRASACRSP